MSGASWREEGAKVPWQRESCDQPQPILLIYHQLVWGRGEEEPREG